MFKVTFYISIILFFNSCSSNLAFKHFNKNQLETKAILYTKKADLFHKNEHKLIIWASYLNPLNIKELNKEHEYFLISTYFTSQEDQNLLNKNYKISLNKKESIKITQIKDDKYLSTKSPWGKKYLVEFRNIEDEKKLIFKIEDKNSNSTVLNFEK